MVQTEAYKIAQKKYRESEKGKASQARRSAKYSQSEKGKAKSKEYRESEAGKASAVRKCAKYNHSEKGKATEALRKRRYAKTPKGKVAQARRDARYNQTEKRKVSIAKYNQSPKGKIVQARKKTKRKRNLDYEPINKKFLGSDRHHLNKQDVIFIPTELHRSIRHKQQNLKSMKVINSASFEWLCTQEMI